IGRHIGHANGMGIDGVEAQAGPRFVNLGGVSGDVEPGVPIKSAAASMLAFTEGLVRWSIRAERGSSIASIAA
ncbi:MAG: hypothetical protein K0U63_03670, partial [Cyanobacteria bacterium]|nr:hypothetical protein [Cyanobacteriota bacterium]